MPDITITLAAAADARDMAEIHARSWEVAYADLIPPETMREVNATRPAMWERKLANGGNVGDYILRDGDTAVGFLGVGDVRLDDDADLDDTFFEIYGLYMHPDHFGRGYGTVAVAFAEELARSRGKRHLVLWAFRDNASASRFYESRGFRLDGAEQVLDFGAPLVGVRWRKDV
ncbi:MAG: GNAT family N-acetyltransferase [Oscillospiraceae bacterium]|jgi:GNAT superfamily N-acetyltransferase|nr:GNAT family N-acetyltransferase [Oscillospiraceae bacterium]